MGRLDLLRTYAGYNREALEKECRERGVHVREGASRGELISHLVSSVQGGGGGDA